jgi:hypothetical protein
MKQKGHPFLTAGVVVLLLFGFAGALVYGPRYWNEEFPTSTTSSSTSSTSSTFTSTTFGGGGSGGSTTTSTSTSSISSTVTSTTASTTHTTSSASSSTTTTSTTRSSTGSVNSNSERLGFWVDERAIWSGGEYQTPPPTPQQFYQDYFDTAPYPAVVLFAIGFTPSGAYDPGVTGEISWLTSVASIASSHPNDGIVILFFVTENGPWDNEGTVINQTWLNYFDSMLSGFEGQSSIIGIQGEFEYVVNSSGSTCGTGCVTSGLIDAFTSTVSSYGLATISSDGEPGFTYTLGYSEYPYLGETIPSSLPSGSIGIGYGETGAPSSGPIWTQQVVDNIVSTSPLAPNSPVGTITLLYCNDDTNNPAGGGNGDPLWNSPTLRGWIYTDQAYASYVESD